MAITIKEEEFGNLFDTFRSSAFRLEKLNEYSVPEEAKEYSRFAAGEPLPESRGEEWCQLVREKVQLGRTMQRVHIVPEPLTTYIKFEIEWRYVYSSVEGEDIYLLKRSMLPSTLEIADDFWLFDRSILIFMRYDSNGSFLRAEKEDRPEIVAAYRDSSAILLSLATPLRQCLAHTRAA